MKRPTFGHRGVADATQGSSGTEATGHKKASIKGIIAGAVLGAVVFAGVLPAMAQTGGSSEAAAEGSTRAAMTAARVKRLARGEIAKALGATGSITMAIANGNVDKVDGYDANDLVRADFAYSDDVADTDGDVLSVDIDAPFDGMLLAWGNVAAVDGGGSIDISCSLEYRRGTLTGEFPGTLRYLYAPDGGHLSCVTSGAVEVDAGSYTVYFSVPDYTANGQTLDAASLQVMFVPFDGTGA